MNRFLLLALAALPLLACDPTTDGLPSPVITVQRVQQHLVLADATAGYYDQVVATDGRVFDGNYVGGLIAAGGKYRIWITNEDLCSPGYVGVAAPAPCISHVQELGS